MQATKLDKLLGRSAMYGEPWLGAPHTIRSLYVRWIEHPLTHISTKDAAPYRFPRRPIGDKHCMTQKVEFDQAEIRLQKFKDRESLKMEKNGLHKVIMMFIFLIYLPKYKI